MTCYQDYLLGHMDQASMTQLSTATAAHIHCAPVVLQCINASPCGHMSGEVDQASLLPFCFLISLLLNKESLSLEEQLCSPVN